MCWLDLRGYGWGLLAEIRGLPVERELRTVVAV
jgi:hypothetical protein